MLSILLECTQLLERNVVHFLVRTGRVGVILLALVLLLTDREAGAADEDDPRLSVEAIAGHLAKGDAKAASQHANFLGKKADFNMRKMRLDEHHQLFAGRARGGLGVGGPGAVRPDGIEAKIAFLAGERPLTARQLAQEKTALQEMAWRTAAIAEVTIAATPPAVRWRKPPWEVLSWDMRDQALKLNHALDIEMPLLAQFMGLEVQPAIDKHKIKEVRRVARALEATCTKCHDFLGPGGGGGGALFQPAK